MQAMLQIENLGKCFADVAALSEIELNLSAGEIFGLIGLNGAGKTTLIKCLLDLHRADNGFISIDGVPSTKELARTKLCYMPEKFIPPDYMTGWGYLEFINKSQLEKSFSRIEAKDKAFSFCNKLDLSKNVLDKSVKKYSKGMLQKLGIIGCLFSDKSLMVLDEPMSGLDPKARVLFHDVVRELKTCNKTILLCTHILNDIETLCDRVGILDQGKLLYVGSPAQCCTQFGAPDLEQAFLACLEKSTNLQA